MNWFKTTDKLIYDAVRAAVPGNVMLAYLIIAQAREESGNYDPIPLGKGGKGSPANQYNNFWGLQWNSEYAQFGGFKTNVTMNNGAAYYTGFPTIQQAVQGLLYLYRDGGKYSGVLEAQSVGDFLKCLNPELYTDSLGGAANYNSEIPQIVQSVMLAHPPVADDSLVTNGSGKKNQLYTSFLATGINNMLAIRHQFFGF